VWDGRGESVRRDLGVLVHQSMGVSVQGAAGGKEGKWYFGLHGGRFRSVVTIIRGLGEATARILRTVLVSLSEEGCSCSRGSAAKFYQADSGMRGTEV